MNVASHEIQSGRVYTLRQACELLRISEATARRWIKEGRLLGRKIGRDYRFLGSDLMAVLDQPPDQIDKLKLLTPDHPLLRLVGAGDSGCTDIADEHDRYLAEFLDKHR